MGAASKPKVPKSTPAKALTTSLTPRLAASNNAPRSRTGGKAKLKLIPGATANNQNHQITLSFGNSNKDTSPTAQTMTWSKLTSLLSIPDPKRGKLNLADYLALDKKIPSQKKVRDAEKNGRYVVGGTFSRPGTRSAADIKEMYCFVGDIDTGTIGKSTLIQKLTGMEFIAFSTYSHHPTSPMWRFVLPFANPVNSADFKKAYALLQLAFDNQLDPRCANTCQIWYTPACPPDAGQYFEFFTGHGDLFDPTVLPDPAMSAKPSGKPANASTAVALAKTPRSLSDYERERIESALQATPSDDRDDWIRVGLALRNDLELSVAHELWIDWSKKSPKFDPDDAESTWASFADDSVAVPVTLGTVFHLAKQNNWVDSHKEMPTAVAALNDTHFLAIQGGKSWVFKEGRDPELNRSKLTRITLSAFREFYANQRVPVPLGDSFKLVDIGTLWHLHPARRSYTSVVFMPDQSAPPGYYNQWQGFQIRAIAGDWSLLQEHILEVICDSDTECYEDLLNWMANAVQHPATPGEVAVVLQGERGTGKGKLASLFGRLFGDHSLQINNSRSLVGHFNAHLETCVFLFVDEAFWAGDKQGENVLKGLITEPTINIERKFQESHPSPNRLHIMMASNNDWVVPAGNMERRYFVLKVNSSHIQDHSYFEAIDDQMLRRGGLEAMMHDLRTRDLTRFDKRKFKWTEALDDQVLRSMEPAMQWWMDFLGETYSTWNFQNRHAMARSFAEANGTYNGKSSQTALGMFLRNVVPGGVKRVSHVFSAGQPPQNCYQLPDQAVCKQALMAKLGITRDPWA